LLLRIDKETEDRRQKAIEEVIKLSMLSSIDLFYLCTYKKDPCLLQVFKTQKPIIFYWSVRK